MAAHGDAIADASASEVVEAGTDAGAFTRPFDCSTNAGYPLLRVALGATISSSDKEFRRGGPTPMRAAAGAW
jgi:hypothetical protein